MIKDVILETGNKFSKEELSTIIIAELDSFKTMFLAGMRNSITDVPSQMLFDASYEEIDKNFVTEELIDTLVFTFPSPRNEFYSQSDFQTLLREVSIEIGEIVDNMGYYPIDIRMPLLDTLQKFDLAILFMSLIFLMILALFVIISVILIYSLLLISIQQKSFDIGIERLVGQTKTGIIVKVVLQTFVFVIPGF